MIIDDDGDDDNGSESAETNIATTRKYLIDVLVKNRGKKEEL